MTLFKGLLAGTVAVAMTGTTACTTNPETGNQRVSRAAIGGVAGAVGGYLIGDLVGGRRDRTEHTAAGKQQNRRVEIRIVPITRQDVNAAGGQAAKRSQ